MKRVLLAASAALLVGAISTPALAQSTGTGNVSATIVAPITVTETTPLNFGLVAASAAAGTVTIVAASGETGASAGGATLLSGATDVVGVFTFNGAAGTTYDVTIPGSTDITITDGTNNMDVHLTLGGTTTGIAGGANEVVYVGGTLDVGVNQPAGAYAGTYTIQAQYN